MAAVVLVQLIIAGVGLLVIVAAVTTSGRRRRTARPSTTAAAPSSAVVAGLLIHPPAPRRQRLPGLRRVYRCTVHSLGRTSVRAAGAMRRGSLRAAARTRRGSVVGGAALRRTSVRVAAAARHLRGQLTLWTSQGLAAGARGQRCGVRGAARTVTAARGAWNEHVPEMREELRRLVATDGPPAPRHRA